MLVLLVGNVINLTIAQLTPKFFEVDPHTVQPSSCCTLRPDQAPWTCQALYTHGLGTQHRKTVQLACLWGSHGRPFKQCVIKTCPHSCVISLNSLSAIFKLPVLKLQNRCTMQGLLRLACAQAGLCKARFCSCLCLRGWSISSSWEERYPWQNSSNP